MNSLRTVCFLLMLLQIYCDEYTGVRYCTAEVLNSTIHKLGWKLAAVLHDNGNAGMLHNIQHVELMVYEVYNEAATETVLREIYEHLLPHLNVILAFENSRVLKKIINEADEYDTKMNHSTDWSHHSKWLVFSSDKEVLQNVKVQNLQNIAVVTFDVRHVPCSVDVFNLQGKHFQPANETGPFLLRMFPNTQYRYNRRLFRVTAMAAPPFVIPTTLDVKDGIPFTGYCIDVLHTIAEFLNFTLKYVEPFDGTWGWVDDGMMGQLLRREIDMVASEMTVHVTRAQHMDYITPFLATDQLVLLYKMPPATEPIFLLTQPFQTQVYLVYAAAALGLSILLLLVESVGTRPAQTDERRLKYFCGIILKTSLKQGSSLKYLYPPGRILFGFWCFSVMLISALYCGNLTATLAANSPLRKFRTIDDLLNSDFRVGLIPGSIIEQILKNSTQADAKRLYQRIRSLSMVDPGVTSRSYDFHRQRVQDGKYAYVTYGYSAERYMKNYCNLTRLFSGSMAQDAMTFFVQKNSPFKEDINNVMRLLNSRGILKKLWQKWNKQITTTDCAEGKRNVTLMDLIGGIVVGGAGIGLALLSLVFEKLLAWYRRT